MHMPRKKPKSCTTTRVFPNQNKVVGAVTKPHIIHILADDLGWSEVGAIVELWIWTEHEILCEKSTTI